MKGLLLLAATALALAACADRDAPPGAVSPADLAAVLGRERLVEPRLSIAPVHRPCDHTDGSPLCAPLPAPGSDRHARVLRLAGRAGALADGGAHPDALWLLGLVELLWAGAGNSPDASVQLLEEAALLAPAEPDVLADLAAARLVRHQAGGSAADLLRALDAAVAALHRDAGHAAAGFNLALTWERLGLRDAATETWETLADAGRAFGDGWRREARARADRLALDRPPSFAAAAARVAAGDPTAGPTPPSDPSVDPAAGPSADPSADPSAADLADAAPRDPEGAREWAMDRALPAWGRAVLAGDTATAARWLRLAATVGDALADAGLDRTVQRTADAAAAADAAARRATDATADAPRPARLLAGYGDARARYAAGDYAAARDAFAALEALATAADGPLLAWIRFYHGASLLNTGDRAAGDRRFDAALRGTDPVAYPVVAGRVAWARGVAAARAGRWARAASLYRDALGRLDGAGERAGAGALEGLIAGAELELGSPHRSLEWRHRALRRLGAARGSVWLHNDLIGVAHVASELGLPHAAVALQTEGLAAARATGRPVYEAEALIRRARLFLRQGRRDDALADVDLARRVTARVESESSRAWLRADLLSLAGEAGAVGAPGAEGMPGGRVAALDTAIAHFQSLGNVFRLAPLLGARARVHLGTGDDAAAERDLRRVVGLVEAQRLERDDPVQRAALLDAARPAFDALIALELGRGRAAAALALAEQGRAVPGPVVPDADRPAAAELAARLDDRAAAVAYAVLGDTIVIWTLRAGAIDARQVGATGDLARTIERVRVAGARGAGAPALAADLQALHRLLVHPVADLIAGATDLFVVPDGPLHDVPFAALHGPDGYLVERAGVRVIPSLAALAVGGPVGAGPGAPGLPTATADTAGTAPWTGPSGALLVAAPAGGPGLPPLPGAAAELAALRGLYEDADVLEPGAGDDTVAELARRLASARLFHFAGHAVSDPARPDRSYLHLGGGAADPADPAGPGDPAGPASPADPAGPARLTAAAIRALRLDGLELAVLSACYTLTAAGTRSGGFDGVARSFLAAGARGVLGTLWEVDDDVARELAVRFHRELRAGRPPADALRAAQRALLESGDPTLASPAAWAAFRYVGR